MRNEQAKAGFSFKIPKKLRSFFAEKDAHTVRHYRRLIETDIKQAFHSHPEWKETGQTVEEIGAIIAKIHRDYNPFRYNEKITQLQGVMWNIAKDELRQQLLTKNGVKKAAKKAKKVSSNQRQVYSHNKLCEIFDSLKLTRDAAAAGTGIHKEDILKINNGTYNQGRGTCTKLIRRYIDFLAAKGANVEGVLSNA